MGTNRHAPRHRTRFVPNGRSIRPFNVTVSAAWRRKFIFVKSRKAVARNDLEPAGVAAACVTGSTVHGKKRTLATAVIQPAGPKHDRWDWHI